MACPVCGKRVQGENVLWTHMVFKHPDKANDHAMGQGNEQVSEENTQPSVELKDQPQKRLRTELSRPLKLAWERRREKRSALPVIPTPMCTCWDME